MRVLTTWRRHTGTLELDFAKLQLFQEFTIVEGSKDLSSTKKDAVLGSEATNR